MSRPSDALTDDLSALGVVFVSKGASAEKVLFMYPYIGAKYAGMFVLSLNLCAIIFIQIQPVALIAALKWTMINRQH